MESGDGLSAPQGPSTVRVSKERPSENKKRHFWCTEDNWPRLKKALANSWYPDVIVQCAEACL